MILDQPDTTPDNDVINPTNFLDLDMQMLSEQPFLMGDFLRDAPFDGYNPTKQTAFDPALWPIDAANQTPRFGDISTNTNLDYFALEEPETEAVVAPSDLTSSSRPTTKIKKEAIATDSPDTPRVPKKRGRKRKQLNEEAQIVERKKFLERNRVAANRCRERKKTYVSNLESRGKDLLNRNTFLRAELERLREEVESLRLLVGIKCECDEEALAQNLRERLGASGMVEDGVEEIVQRFLRLKTEGSQGMGMKVWEGMGSVSSSSSSSGMDDVFSPAAEREDGGESSSQNSPVDNNEAEKLNYLAL